MCRASCGLDERHFVLGWRTALRSLTVLGRPQSDFSSPQLLPPRPAKIQRTLQRYITVKYSPRSSICPKLAYSVLQSNGHVPRLPNSPRLARCPADNLLKIM